MNSLAFIFSIKNNDHLLEKNKIKDNQSPRCENTIRIWLFFMNSSVYPQVNYINGIS